MDAAVLGEAVTHLPWLSPCAASLVTLARSADPSAWNAVRFDPGAVLLLASWNPVPSPPGPALFARALHEPSVLEIALRHFDHSVSGAVDWSDERVRPVYETSLRYARLARAIAQRAGRCDPDCAWAAGLLVPLGWLAVAAVDPQAVVDCLADPRLGTDPASLQRERWGFDNAAIARRLARRWRLPRWLGVITGHLELPPAVAEMLGGELRLCAVIQLAIATNEASPLHLQPAMDREESAAALGLGTSALESIVRDAETAVEDYAPPTAWAAPRSAPLLRDLLVLAIENRRVLNAPVLEQAESEDDFLQQALRAQRAGEEERLRARKLTALAEFAAGAGHEINNPLAVISGQAQYLLHHESDPSKQRALQAIVGQTQRIHQILGELMQFARPAHPAPQTVEALATVREVTGALRELAEHRRVQVVAPPPHQLASVYADPRQLQTALGCLLRNAIEAAPVDGWAGIQFDVTADRVEFIVEDNGPSLDAGQREHAFDPFYSGRQAGRGRGLGLPTAWRLARENGGDVRFEDVPGGATRFLLSLPLAASTNGAHNGHHHESLQAPLIGEAEAQAKAS